MKVSKSLLAVIAMAGTMGFSAVASAMDFSLYGNLRGGLRQTDTDNYQTANTSTVDAAYLDTVAGHLTVAEIRAALTAAELASLDPTDNDVAITDTEVGALTGADLIGLLGSEQEVVVTGGNPAVEYSDVEFEEGSTLSGTVAIDAQALAEGGRGETEADDAQLQLGHGVSASRIGIRGSEDLGNGAESGLNWEVGVADDGAVTGRRANVWYSGAFGKLTIGQQTNPYENAANWDQSNFLGGNNRYGLGTNPQQGIRYDGEAGAFNFSVMAVANNDDGYAAAEGKAFIFDPVGAHAGADGTAGNADDLAGDLSSARLEYAETEAETGIDAWIATGHYDMGVATINLGYQIDNQEAQAVGQAFDNFVISANGSLDALDWYVAYESNTDNANVKTADTSPIEAIDTANLAGAALTAAQEQNALFADANRNVDLVADAYGTAQDNKTIALFLGYHISDVSTVYLEWEDTSSDGLDTAGDTLDKNATLLGYSRRFGPSTLFSAEYVTVDNGSEIGEDNQDSSTITAQMRVDF